MSSQIPEKIQALNFPDIEHVVLAGSGVLELAGIRPAADIDLATNLENVNHLLDGDPNQWRRKVHTFTRIKDGTSFQKTSVEDIDGQFDIWRHWYHAGRPVGERIISIDELIDNSRQHKLGFYVVNLSFMMEMKASSGRPKDIEDLRRYHQYIEWGY